jgi:tRNA dimethylallyltransferase
LEFGIWNLELGIKTLLVILGPTASGKTDLAIKLAKRYGTEIISADSRQFYRELSIGTAKPSPEQLAEVKHYFIGHISINDRYSVAGFEKDAIRLLHELFQVHDVVVMCGGSGLYIDAVCHGIDEQPDNDPVTRNMLTEMYKTHGISYLQEQLCSLDPEYYREVDLSNPHRLIRALEVCMVTGKPFSSFRKGGKKERDFRIVKLGIDISREELITRINHRVDAMISSGLEEEARGYYDKRHLNALNTVGYKEMFAYFDGEISREEAIEKIRINTRRYAKRQMTWFRKDEAINWIKPGTLEQWNNGTIEQ